MTFIINFRKIKELRQTNEISQYQMAHYLSLTPSAYSKKESGHRQFSIEELVKIAKFFHCDLQKLLQ